MQKVEEGTRTGPRGKDKPWQSGEVEGTGMFHVPVQDADGTVALSQTVPKMEPTPFRRRDS